MSLTSEQRARFAEHRAKGVAAAMAYRWVTTTPVDVEDSEPRLTWGESRTSYLPNGQGQVEGFDVLVTFEEDYDLQPMGTFSEEYEPGAIINPRASYCGMGWDRYDRQVPRYSEPRYYVDESGETLEALTRYYHKAGMSKSAALDTATEAMQSWARAAHDQSAYVAHVSVSRAGVHLGDDYLGTGAMSTDYEGLDTLRSDLISMVYEHGMIETAIEEAQAALARLVSA